MPQLEFPDHIAHKPVYLVPYHDHDPGREGNTDAQYLSVGWSQWDNNELSAKVVRHTGERWSRQSEELPLARLVDLTMLTALAFGEESLTRLEPNTLQNQSQAIDVAYGSRRDREYLVRQLRDDEVLRGRFRRLLDVLQDIERAGALRD